MPELIHRSFADAEIRADADGRTLCGVACPFDSPTDVGYYTETIRRGAFARTIAERGAGRVKVLAQHNATVNPIGRASVLREDTAGLYAEMRLSKTQAADEALELVRDGVLDGLSIGFVAVPATDVWHHDRNLVERTEVKLHEISVVTWPAYDAARIAQVRSAPFTYLDELDLARRRTALASITGGLPRV